MAYPSPGKGPVMWFYFQGDVPGDVRMQIYNVVGERVADWTGMPDVFSGYARLRWNLSEIAPGVYFCRLFTSRAGGEKLIGRIKIAVVK